jgi:acylphosphatase
MFTLVARMVTGRLVHYEGRVQGVGFRYTARRIAQGYDVAGRVKNLPDGRVEMRVFGEAEEVDAFLEAVANSELESHIRNVAVAGIPVETVRGFEISA